MIVVDSVGRGDAVFHDAVAALLAGRTPRADMDLVAFATWASRHRVGPYLSRIAAVLSPPIEAALRPGLMGAHAFWMVREASTRAVLDALGRAGAAPVLFKGLGAALLVYPDPAERPLGDLDLLLRPGTLPNALAALTALGCRPRSEDPAVVDYFTNDNYQYPVIHPDLGLIELHHRLWPDLPEGFTERLLSATRTHSAHGFSFEAPSGPDLFAALLCHFGIAGPGTNWGWLLDLLLLGRGFDRSQWKTVVGLVQDNGLQLYLALALRLMDDLWGISLGDLKILEIESQLRRPERLLLARYRSLRAGGVLSGDHLRLARLLSRRPTRRTRSRLRPLWSHPGVVSLDLGVPSTTPHFAFHRAKHLAQRVRRLMGR